MRQFIYRAWQILCFAWEIFLGFLHVLKRSFQSIVLTSFLILAPLAAIVSGSVTGILQGFYEQLPEPRQTDLSPSLTSRIFDRNGNLLDVVGDTDSRLKLVQLKDLPPHIGQAFVAIEDERFYKHFGIDFLGIAGAFVDNIRQGGLSRGASTITQQLIRNVYLSPEKSITRKLKEMMLAMRLEYSFTKAEILEMYINTVFFGETFYGIEAASWNFFSKTTKDLSIAEVAVLAALMKAPNNYSPVANPRACLMRRDAVLRKMLELGYLTRPQFEKEKATPIVVKRPVEQKKAISSVAPYFVDVVKRELYEIIGPNKVNKGGLKVITTLDLEMHRYAKKAYDEAGIFKTYPLARYPTLGGALVVRDVHTGEVLSLIGGRDFDISQYNRATQAHRQPGSCFKVFIYSAAFEFGISPNLVLNDTPTTYVVADTGRTWTPQNYGGQYHGLTVLRTALENSYNVTAVKLLDKVGIKNAIQIARRMGIRSPIHENLTMALGSTEVLPIEILSAFSCLANQGIYVESKYILRVEDQNGLIIYEAKHNEHVAVSATTAYMVYDIMRGVVNNGSGRRAAVEGVDVAGKTGTNQDYIDAWFVGITPTIGAVFTVGFNERRSLGKAPSSQTAAPVVGDFFRYMKAHMPHVFDGYSIVKPPNVETMKICRDSGNLASEGCPNTVDENFIKGKEPRHLCNHSSAMLDDTENEYNVFDMDGSQNTESPAEEIPPAGDDSDTAGLLE